MSKYSNHSEMKSKAQGFLKENERELASDVNIFKGKKSFKVAFYLLKYLLHILLFLSSCLL